MLVWLHKTRANQRGQVKKRHEESCCWQLEKLCGILCKPLQVPRGQVKKMKQKYKIRMNCVSFTDLVILANSKKKARELAEKYAQCPQDDMEFGEFLELEDKDEVDYEDYD